MPASSCAGSKPYANPEPRTYPTQRRIPTHRSDHRPCASAPTALTSADQIRASQPEKRGSTQPLTMGSCIPHTTVPSGMIRTKSAGSEAVISWYVRIAPTVRQPARWDNVAAAGSPGLSQGGAGDHRHDVVVLRSRQRLPTLLNDLPMPNSNPHVMSSQSYNACFAATSNSSISAFVIGALQRPTFLTCGITGVTAS